MCGKRLLKGEKLGLERYWVVGVLDWVRKVVMDLVKGGGFEKWKRKGERDLGGEMRKFLDRIEGGGGLIEKLKIVGLEGDGKEKEGILVEIEVSGYLGGKSFVMKLEGRKGDEEKEWKREYGEDG